MPERHKERAAVGAQASVPAVRRHPDGVFSETLRAGKDAREPHARMRALQTESVSGHTIQPSAAARPSALSRTRTRRS